MLRKLDDLHGFAIHATDGAIGEVKDFYFDDQAWVMRYFVVETGSWLSSRKVLISPISAGAPDWAGEVLPVSITMEQVRNSPDIDTDRPVSRQHEGDLLAYYAYPLYWNGPGIWGADTFPNPQQMAMPEFSSTPSVILPVPDELPAVDVDSTDVPESERRVDPDLRSASEMKDYRIEATDGEIGRLQGLLVDEKTWAIRYIIVNTGNWWLGHQILIEPASIREVSWFDSMVMLNLSRQQVQEAPHYDPKAQADED